MSDSPQTVADLLGKTTPALSATSDMPADEPNTPQAPALSEQRTGAPDPGPDKTGQEPVAEAEPEPEDGEEPEDPVVEGEPKPVRAKRQTMQERMSELSAARREAEARATRAEQTAQKALDAVTKLTESQQAAKDAAEAQPDPRPLRDAFDSPDAYDDALVAWSSRVAERTTEARVKRETEAAAAEAERVKTEDAQKAENQRLADDWNARKDKVTEKYPDYADVAERDDLTITLPMSHAILNADNGPDIAYYLGKNPEEATRIAGLNPLMQVIEMGKLSAKVAESAVTLTRATPPIRPLRTAAAAATAKGPNEESMDEYAARRQAELRSRRN